MSKGFHRLPIAEPWSNRARGLQARDIALHGDAPSDEHIGPISANNRPTRIEREAPVPAIQFEPGPAKMTREEARGKGFTGNTCTNCGSSEMQIAGHCEVCASCGTTTGCS